MNTAERNYSTIERELLAIVFAVEKFRYYLYGKPFTIITDHNPLVYLNNITLTSERLTRWRLKLAEYDFNVTYRKGKANGNADAMSRIEDIPDDNKNKEDLIEALLAVNIEDKITYKENDIFTSKEDEGIVHCVSADLQNRNGVSKQIFDKCGGISSLSRHKRKVGMCLVRQKWRPLFFLITKKHYSDKPSYDNFKQCIFSLKEKCQEYNVKTLAFPKYGAGLDKLTGETSPS